MWSTQWRRVEKRTVPDFWPEAATRSTSCLTSPSKSVRLEKERGKVDPKRSDEVGSKSKAYKTKDSSS